MEKKEKKIGTVTHWYDRIGVAVVKLSAGLKRNDTIKVKKGDEEFEHSVTSIQIDHVDVDSAQKGDDAAIKLPRHAREGATVFLVK